MTALYILSICSSIKINLTPVNLWTGVASNWSSIWFWNNWEQSCVYSFWDWSSWNQFESWFRDDFCWVIRSTRTDTLREISITSVDKNNITITGSFLWFYQLIINR